MVPTPTPDGLLFRPSPNGKIYVSLYYHRGAGSPVKKSCWAKSCPPLNEFQIFCQADKFDWCTPDGNYWGMHEKGRTVLGTRGERLCKFPMNTNQTLPWHGFPVNTGETKINDELVEKWKENGEIPRDLARKIRRRRA